MKGRARMSGTDPKTIRTTKASRMERGPTLSPLKTATLAALTAGHSTPLSRHDVEICAAEPSRCAIPSQKPPSHGKCGSLAIYAPAVSRLCSSIEQRRGGRGEQFWDHSCFLRGPKGIPVNRCRRHCNSTSAPAIDDVLRRGRHLRAGPGGNLEPMDTCVRSQR